MVWFDQILNGLVLGNIYSLLAAGLALIFGVAHLINFAHGSVFMAGGYTGWVLITKMELPLSLALPGAVLAAGAVGYIVERAALRPFRSSARIAPLLATIGVSFVLNSVAEIVFTPNPQAFPPVLPPLEFALGGVRLGYLDLLILALGLVSGGFLFGFLKFSRLGQALRASAQDPDAAKQMGVRVNSVNSAAFATASAMGGLGGVLIGLYYNSVSPTMGTLMGLKGFTACILGGISSVPAAMAGGLVLGILESVGVGIFGSAVRNLFSFTVLLVILLIRPQGLFTRRKSSAKEPLTGTFLPQAKAFRVPAKLSAAIIVTAFILPLAIKSAYLLQILTMIWIFALFAVSLTLTAGTAGMITLGHAGLMAVGAYTSGLLTVRLGTSFPVALISAGFMSALVGSTLAAPAIRLKGHYLSIATLAIGEIVNQVILNWDGLTRGAMGLGGIPVPRVFGKELLAVGEIYYLYLTLLVLGGLVISLVIKAPLGRTLRAVREDETAARSLGIPVGGYKTLAFSLSGFLAGIAGALSAHMYSYINFETFNSNVSILALTMVILGGLGQTWGAVLGAAALISLPELLRPVAEYRWLLYGFVLLVSLRYRPQGVLGSV